MLLRRKTQYRWALWVGLALMVLGLGASWLFFGDNRNTDASFDWMLPRWLMAITICVVAPVLEEMTFRLWAVGKRWCGIVSALLAAAFVWRVTGHWWLGLTMAATMAVCLFAIRSRRLRDILLMLLTSAVFAACHSGNFIAVDLDAVLVMTSNFGFGLLACFLVINHGIVWAILLHVLNNTVAFVGLTITTAVWSTSIGTDRYEMTLRYGSEFEISQSGDTMIRCQTLPEFCFDLAWNQQHADSVDMPLQFCYYDISRSHKEQRYRFTVVDRQPFTRSDYWPLLEALRDSGLVHIDTLREPAVRLVVADTALLMQTRYLKPDDVPYAVTLGEVENSCRSRLRMPMLCEHSWEDTLYLSDFESFGRFMYTDPPDSTALLPWLEARGLQIIPAIGDTVSIIQFR